MVWVAELIQTMELVPDITVAMTRILTEHTGWQRAALLQYLNRGIRRTLEHMTK